ncbi:MAG: SprT-like domain-containing protein [Bacilli bacterium]
MLKPTNQVYEPLQKAYDFFNQELFNNELPDCLITLRSIKSGVLGYYWDSCFASTNDEITDEIAMNAKYFGTRSLDEVLATLVHEMVHLWQQHFGKPSRRTYHNKEWAKKMKDVGLQPSSSGKLGGDETGQSMHHYIIDNGVFFITIKKLLETDFHLLWFDRYIPNSTDLTKISTANIKKMVRLDNSKIKSKYSHTCEAGTFNVWGKAGIRLTCGVCKKSYVEETN